MDKTVVEEALKAKLTANEWKVLAAMSLGHLGTYDIQRVTSLKKYQVETIAQNKHSILRIQDSEESKSFSSSAQNEQRSTLTPPMFFIGLLYEKLGLTLKPRTFELTAAVAAYEIAYKFTGRNGKFDQAEAVALLEDCLRYKLTELKHYNVRAHMSYFKQVLESYLTSIPEMPVAIYERAIAKNLRFSYNPNTKQWEVPDEHISQ